LWISRRTLIAGYWDNEEDVWQVEKPIVVFGDPTRCLKYIDFNFVLGADGVKILKPKEIINAKFLYYCLKAAAIPNLGYSRHFKLLKDIQIPLPPLSVQQQIVAKIESYQAIINPESSLANFSNDRH
jgi:type I restriction enzyme S subunit